LTLTRVLPAAPERVWHALTDPAELAAWFWPERLSPAVSVTTAGFRIEAGAAGFAVSGSYVDMDPPHRLVFTWRWDAAPAEETLVTVRLEPADGGTLLTLVHERFTDTTDRDNHLTGWEDCLDRLPAHLRTHP
jgi:uncharacterized protein YndB with AHSA1/START domain